MLISTYFYLFISTHLLHLKYPPVALLCLFQLSWQTQQKSNLHLEHFIWLHPSFFCMGLLQLGQGLELVTNHKQLAASSDSEQVALSSSGLTSDIFLCHSSHWEHPEGACASPRHSQQKKWAFPQSTAWDVAGTKESIVK